MKAIAMFGVRRDNLGKSSTKLLRSEGKVPCVLYGGTLQAPVHFYMYSSDFQLLVYTPNTYKARLDLDGEIHEAVLQDIQFHPVNETILHADFMQVDELKPITLGIPVKVSGNSPGVREGGNLVKKIRKMSVRGLIKDMPDCIEVNIDSLELGKSIKVSDISLPGLAILDSPVNAIVSVTATRATREAAAAAGK